MSTDEQADPTARCDMVTAMGSDATHEAQDGPVGVEIASCPSCGREGTAYRKAHGAGTRIAHAQRPFPCSTATVMPELDEPGASRPAQT